MDGTPGRAVHILSPQVMVFQWAPLLLSLLVLPLLVAVYIWMQRRRRPYAIRYSSISLIKPVATAPSWRRHIPPALFMLALVALLVGLARPVAVVRAPSQQGIVILALDSSGSMRADDLQPTRLEAAKHAARTFIQNRQPGIQIGLVAFGGVAAVVQPPTEDPDLLYRAMDRLYYQRGTAVGSAILTSLDAIQEMGLDDLPGMRPAGPPTPAPTPVPENFFASAVIVLLTDGQSNRGPLAAEAAQEAALRGIRVFTVGVGTVEGTIISSSYGGGYATELDEVSLKQVAQVTQAEYFHAEDEDELERIYYELSSQITLKLQRIELTAVLTGAALLVLLAAMFLSMLWSGPLG